MSLFLARQSVIPCVLFTIIFIQCRVNSLFPGSCQLTDTELKVA